MEWLELLKAFGPQAVPWVGLYVGARWVMERSDKDMESRIELATALSGLTRIIEGLKK